MEFCQKRRAAMDENIFWILATALVVTGSAVSIYFRRRADRASNGEGISLRSERPALRISLRVAGMALWLCVLGYLVNPAWILWSQVHFPAGLRLAGGALGGIAVLLAYWVFFNLGSNVTPTVVTRRKHRVVTTGPDLWVRHPLYVVGFLSYLSFALLAANWFVALLAIVTLYLISLRIPTEEAALAQRDGEAYVAYMARAGRYLPRRG